MYIMKILRLFIILVSTFWFSIVSAQAATIDFTDKVVYGVVESDNKIDIVVIMPGVTASTESYSAELQMGGKIYNSSFAYTNISQSSLSSLSSNSDSSVFMADFDINVDILSSYALRVRNSNWVLVNLSGAVINTWTNVLPNRYLKLDNISVPVPGASSTISSATTTTSTGTTTTSSNVKYTKNYKSRFNSRSEEPSRINGIGNNPNYKSWDANSPR